MKTLIDEILDNTHNYTLCWTTFRVKKEDDLFLLCEIFPEDFICYSGFRGEEDDLLEGILDSIDVSAFIKKEGFYEGFILFAYEEYEANIGGFYIEEIKVQNFFTIEERLDSEFAYFNLMETEVFENGLPF